MWIGFSGTRAGEYLADLGLGGNNLIFSCRDIPELNVLMQNIINRNTYSVENEFLRESFLYQVFAVLSRSLKVQSLSADEKDPDNIYVRQAVEYIQNNYLEPVRVG